MEMYIHLGEKEKEVVARSKEERIRYLNEPVWIAYPRAKKLLQILNNLKEHPKRSRMPNLLIIGESFIGKTSIIEKFVEMCPAVQYEDAESIMRVNKSVVLITAPDTADMKNLYIKILEQFWTSFPPNATASKLRHQTLHLLRECHTKVLIIDEIHNLLETTMTKQRLIMNGIKNISNELKIPIVGAGTDIAAKILSSDPQHASRFDVVRLARWELNKEYLGLLKAFEKKLPLKKPSHLYSKEKAQLLYHISSGNLGNLHKLLMTCAIDAIENGEEEITAEIIRKNKWIKPPSEGMPVEIPLV